MSNDPHTPPPTQQQHGVQPQAPIGPGQPQAPGDQLVQPKVSIPQRRKVNPIAACLGGALALMLSGGVVTAAVIVDDDGSEAVDRPVSTQDREHMAGLPVSPIPDMSALTCQLSAAATKANNILDPGVVAAIEQAADRAQNLDIRFSAFSLVDEYEKTEGAINAVAAGNADSDAVIGMSFRLKGAMTTLNRTCIRAGLTYL